MFCGRNLGVVVLNWFIFGFGFIFVIGVCLGFVRMFGGEEVGVYDIVFEWYGVVFLWLG